MTERRDPRVRLTAAALIAAMAVGSVVLWLGIPFGWILLASHLTHTSQPTMGPYVLVLFGIPISMVAVGKLLAALNRRYAQVTHTDATVHVQTPWLRSMRGERGAPRPHSVLDVVMVLSVSAAVLAAAVWFFLFAGSSLPT